MTALWILTASVLGKEIKGLQFKPIQSDRMFLPDRTEGLATGKVLLADELLRYGHAMWKTECSARAVLGLKGWNEDRLSGRLTRIVASYIERPPSVTGFEDEDEKSDEFREALKYHVEVARVLAVNGVPHASDACYSEELRMDAREFQELQLACEAFSRVWDVTPQATFRGTSARQYTIFLGGQLWKNLGLRLGFESDEGPGEILASARVSWLVRWTGLDEVFVRFVPRAMPHALREDELRRLLPQATADLVRSDCVPGDKVVWRRSAERAVALMSAVVLETWKEFVQQVGVLDDDRLQRITPDDEALVYLQGRQWLQSRDSLRATVDWRSWYAIDESHRAHKQPEKDALKPMFDPDFDLVADTRGAIPVTFENSHWVYAVVEGVKRPAAGKALRYEALLERIQDRYRQAHPEASSYADLTLEEQDKLHGNVLLVKDNLSTVWLRSEWESDGTGYLVPAVRSAEVSPHDENNLPRDFLGSRLAPQESYRSYIDSAGGQDGRIFGEFWYERWGTGEIPREPVAEGGR
ncbi:MAG: hypothetical protein LBV06_03420 [Propionibacteriaceae bacterium]|nr:hypothetical protein [Propionibacteriaceae bacterium]